MVVVLLYIARAGFKKQKVNRYFWSLRRNCNTLWQSDSQLRAITHNLFAFIANHFAKGICNYPKSDSHLTMLYRLFLALY